MLTEAAIFLDDTVDPYLGTPTYNTSELEDTADNKSNDMNCFLPVGEQQEQDLDAVRSQLSPVVSLI